MAGPFISELGDGRGRVKTDSINLRLTCFSFQYNRGQSLGIIWLAKSSEQLSFSDPVALSTQKVKNGI